MATFTVLVLGPTGPAGICLLRELLHRSRPTIAYARNPSKIPAQLASHLLLEVVEGQMTDKEALNSCMARCNLVISLLGPDINDKNIDPCLFADMYRSYVFPAMRQYEVLRIVAMRTISIRRPEDRWTLFQPLVVLFMRYFANAIFHNMINIVVAFEEAQDLDWTIFRIAKISGESDHGSGTQDRGRGVCSGWVGETGWTASLDRAALTHWLADAADNGLHEWICKMPAVSCHGVVTS